MCTFFFSYKAIVPVHENLILIAYTIIPKVTSTILPLMTKMFSDYIELGYIKLCLIFGLSLHLNDTAHCNNLLGLLKHKT